MAKRRPLPTRSTVAAAPSPGGKGIAVPFAIAAVAVLAYANSLGNGFVWDDPIILTRQLVVFRTWSDVVLPPRGIPQYSPDYYRPVTTASYLIDRALGDAQPFFFHLSVVLAHALTSVLVYLLGRRLYEGRGARGEGRGGFVPQAAAIAGLLFAVHPVHTESVAWSAGRSDVLATFFSLAALLLHIGTTRPDWRRSAATAACVALALGAKETAVAVLPALVLYDLALRPGPLRSGMLLRGWAAPFCAALVYVLLRRATLGELVGSAPGETPVSAALGTVVGAIGIYAGKLLWPVELNAYIDKVPTGTGAWLFSLACIAIAATVAAWSWARGRMVLPFLLGWMAACLAPSLTIAWKIPDAPLAERYLYMPSVPFCLLVACAVAALRPRLRSAAMRRAAGALVGVVLLASATATVLRNRVWHDDVRLWEDTTRKSHVSGMPLRSLAAAYHGQGRREEARRTFETALARRNSPVGLLVIHNNLGTLAMLDGRLAEAERHYREALQVEPNAPDALFNLGLVLLEEGGRTPAAAARASPYLSRALAASPFDPDVQAAVGQTKAILGDVPGAVQHLERALELGLNPVSAKRVEALLADVRARSKPSR